MKYLDEMLDQTQKRNEIFEREEQKKEEEKRKKAQLREQKRQ